jgi:selenide,water dikinase
LAQVLRPLSGIFQPENYPNLLVGLDKPDDSAVYQVADNLAIISTMDFFPPVVDDPYHFGAIAAANALSDVYAMGGTPIMAINLVAFPDGIDNAITILSEILRGGAEKVREAGAVIAGGHTVTDKEPKYGLSVTGHIHPKAIMQKGGAQTGDLLILTKPLGSGVITTAHKNSRVEQTHLDNAIQVMSRLNNHAGRLAVQFGASAMTDITGFGLIGHSYEMANASQKSFHIHYSALHWMDGAQAYAEQSIFAGGLFRNKNYFEQWVDIQADIAEYQQNLLYDPQTSGGLLIAIHEVNADKLLDELGNVGDDARIIGQVFNGNQPIVVKA